MKDKLVQPPILYWNLLFFYVLFIYFERDRQHEWGKDSDRGRDRIPSMFCTASTEADVGLEPTNREIMTWAKTKSQMPNRLNHPGTPGQLFSWEQVLKRQARKAGPMRTKRNRWRESPWAKEGASGWACQGQTLACFVLLLRLTLVIKVHFDL